MKNEDPYIDPACGVLRNKLGLTDAAALDVHERRLVAQRIVEGVPDGRFDLDHLRAIHRHLFQDVYDWAGEIRTVEIQKGATLFQPIRFIAIGMTDVHQRLSDKRFLRGLGSETFSSEAGIIIGDINHIHPFREGNGRTQLLYMQLLARQAGYRLDLTKLTGATWIAACQEAHMGRYGELAAALRGALSDDGG